MSAIHLIGQAAFTTDVLESNLPVMVDFYADWCGPCKLAAPIMEKLATEYDKKAVVIKLDVDNPENRAIAQQFQVMSIPTVITFAGGKQIDTATGFIGESGYRSLLEKALQAKTK